MNNAAGKKVALEILIKRMNEKVRGRMTPKFIQEGVGGKGGGGIREEEKG